MRLWEAFFTLVQRAQNLTLFHKINRSRHYSALKPWQVILHNTNQPRPWIHPLKRSIWKSPRSNGLSYYDWFNNNNLIVYNCPNQGTQANQLAWHGAIECLHLSSWRSFCLWTPGHLLLGDRKMISIASIPPPPHSLKPQRLQTQAQLICHAGLFCAVRASTINPHHGFHSC